MSKPTKIGQACKLLRRAAKYLCADDPEQGDYCRCGAYVGAGERHRAECLYKDIQKFLREEEKSG